MDGTEEKSVLADKKKLAALVKSGDLDGVRVMALPEATETPALLVAAIELLKEIQSKDWNWKASASDFTRMRGILESASCLNRSDSLPAKASSSQPALPKTDLAAPKRTQRKRTSDDQRILEEAANYIRDLQNDGRRTRTKTARAG